MYINKNLHTLSLYSQEKLSKQAGAELCQAQAQVTFLAEAALNIKVVFHIWVLSEKTYISLYFADFQLLRSCPMEVVLLSKIFQIV